MSEKYINFTQNSYHYYQQIATNLPSLYTELINETEKLGPIGKMYSPPEQLQFLAFLTQLIKPKKILEIGTFTGLSALIFAQYSPNNCQITCCDINEEWTNIAKKYWAKAKIDHKIKLILADAKETLKTLDSDFDLIFIDADKAAYLDYFNNCLPLLKPNGVFIFDNTLWKGQLADPTKNSKRIEALRQFNLAFQKNKDILHSVLPLCDGLSLGFKRN